MARPGRRDGSKVADPRNPRPRATDESFQLLVLTAVFLDAATRRYRCRDQQDDDRGRDSPNDPTPGSGQRRRPARDQRDEVEEREARDDEESPTDVGPGDDRRPTVAMLVPSSSQGRGPALADRAHLDAGRGAERVGAAGADLRLARATVH
jgi:hypothetical protein